MLILKTGEPPYNLRSKGKITSTDDPTGNSLVVANNLGIGGETRLGMMTTLSDWKKK